MTQPTTGTSANAHHVWARIQVLRALSSAASLVPPRPLESHLAGGWSAERISEWEQSVIESCGELIAQLRELEALHWANPTELGFLRAPLADGPHHSALLDEARTASLMMLLWAMDICPYIPMPDDLIDPNVVAAIPPKGLSAGVGLRPPSELERMLEICEFWLWRIRTHEDMLHRRVWRSCENTRAVGINSRTDLTKAVAAMVAKERVGIQNNGEDFLYEQTPVWELDPRVFRHARARVKAQYATARWLCGRNSHPWIPVSH